MNDFELSVAALGRPHLVSTLVAAFVHTLWIGACAALLLKGGLDLLPRRRSGRRYVLALLALAALPVGFVLTLVRALGPPRIPPLESLTSALASGPHVGSGAATLADSARLWLTSFLAPAGPWLVALWALGAVVLVLRLLGGWAWCRRFRTRAVPAEPRLQAHLARLGRRLGLRRRARLFLSDTIDVPMVVASGLGDERAAVVVPFRALRDLPPEDLDGLLAHELAHVRRLDGPVHLIQALVEALFFFHPAARWIGARVRAEREHCCDELALVACAGPRVLARALTRLEEHRAPRRLRLAPAVALAASDGCLVGRVERLLGRARPARRVRRVLAVALSLVGLTGLAAGALLRPVAPHAMIFVTQELTADLSFGITPPPTGSSAHVFVLRSENEELSQRRMRVQFVARDAVPSVDEDGFLVLLDGPGHDEWVDEGVWVRASPRSARASSGSSAD